MNMDEISGRVAGRLLDEPGDTLQDIVTKALAQLKKNKVVPSRELLDFVESQVGHGSTVMDVLRMFGIRVVQAKEDLTMTDEQVARELVAAARLLMGAKKTFGDFYVEEGFTNGSDLSKILDKADSSIDIIEDGDTKFELVYNKTLKGFEISLEFLFELERNKVSATCSRWTVEDGEAGDGEEVDKKTFKLTDDIKDASAWIKSCIRKGNKRTFRSSCVSDEQVARELVAAAELLVAGSWETQLSSHFGIEAKPTSKDYKRIEDIGKKALKSVGPFKDEGGMMPPDVERKVKAKEAQLAENMARSITDAAKAYRRALAAEDINYHTVAEAFFDRARVLWNDMT